MVWIADHYINGFLSGDRITLCGPCSPSFSAFSSVTIKLVVAIRIFRGYNPPVWGYIIIQVVDHYVQAIESYIETMREADTQFF